MSAAAVPLPVPVHDPATVRRVAQEVLSRPEYREAAPSLLDRIGEVVLGSLGRLLGSLASGRPAGTIGSIALLVLLLLAAVLAVRFLRGVRRDPAAPSSPALTGRAPGEWRAEAEAHEAAGRWREAVRCRYRFLVAALAEAGVCPEVPGRTAGEYRDEVAAALPAAAAPMRALTATFERAWYGRLPVGAADAAAVAEHAAAVLASLPGRQRVVTR